MVKLIFAFIVILLIVLVIRDIRKNKPTDNEINEELKRVKTSIENENTRSTLKDELQKLEALRMQNKTKNTED